MREYLFRGKRTDNGEWLYGDLLHHADAVKIREQEPEIRRAARSFEVLPETVGQFTGMNDRNGVKVFEGDIIRLYGNMRECYAVYYEDACFTTDAGPCELCVAEEDEIEVTGNVFDNLALLEVSEHDA